MRIKWLGAMAALALALTLQGGAQASAPQSVGPVTTLRLTFAGDCTLGNHEGWMNHSVGTFKVMQKEVGNYTYFLEKCQPLFSQDDFTLVNLEGVLADSAAGLNPERKWNFRGPTEYVNILTQGSVEGVTLGNNHTKDFGAPGLKSTQETLDAAGVAWCLDKKAAFFEKDGVKIAFLGFWETSFNSHRAWLADEIPRLKAQEGCQAVVVLYHGGNEYNQKHADSQQKAMRYAVDCGADLVIGHHPHVLQGVERYKNRMIFYSLGDFCYGGNRKPRAIEYPTMVVSIQMRFDNQGYYAQQATIHPFRISATAPRNNYQPYPASGAEAQQVMQLLQDDTDFTLAPYVDGQGAVQDTLYR